MKLFDLKSSYLLKKQNIKNISIHKQECEKGILTFARVNDKYEYWSDGLWFSLDLRRRDIPQYCFAIEKDLKRIID